MLKRNVVELSEAGAWYRDIAEWRRYVQERDDLSVTDRFVGCFIADRINRADEEMWFKQQTMALKIGVSTDTVGRATKRLELEGLISITRGRRGLRIAVNRYELLFPWK
jgi:DNA-binding MarR family transcriptional regulator